MADDTRFWSVLCWMFSTQLMCRVAMSSEPIVLETNGSNNTNVVASEGDPINIVCTSSNWTALNKGKITLDCPHNIINSTQIGRGTAIRVEFRADRKMDGQHCTCAATLLDTLTTVQRTSTFHITYSTKVASLNILNNVKTNDVNDVSEDVIVVIVCKASGNPAPTARLYFVTEKEKTLVYQSTTRQLEYQTPAQCYRAGRYVCEAENNFSKDSKHTDLWIKCPPELCSGQTSRPVYQVPVNQNFSTSLCVLYWPRHPLGSELSRVSADNSSVESRRLDHHVTVVSRDMRQTIVNLTIFSGPDHQLGEVNLTIEYDVGRFSSMYFKLIKPEGSKLGSMTIAAIVCPIVLVLMLIILVLSVMVWRKRETSDDKAGIVKPEVLPQQCNVIQRFAVDGDGYLMSRDCVGGHVPDTQSLDQPPTDQLDTGDLSKLETRLDENVYSTIDDTHDDYVNAGVSSPQHSAADRTIESSDAVSRCLMLDDRRDAPACCTTRHYTNLCQSQTTNIDDRPYASSENIYFVPI